MKKKMNLPAALFASAVIAFGTCTVVAPVQAADKPMNSKAAGKALQDAKKILDAKRYGEAITKLKEVQNISGRNAYDDFLINQMLSYAYLKSNPPNYAEAEKVLEPMLNSEYVPKSETPTRIKQLLTINYTLKNYDKVISLGETAQKGGYADEEIMTLIGQAYYLKGDYKKSTQYMDGIIQSITKSGKKPKESTLNLVQNACTKSGDNNCLQRTYEQLVTYYPKPQYWENLVGAMYKTAQTGPNNDKNMLQIYRLSAAVDTLKKPSDFTEYAQLALERGAAGEAQAVLEKGFANKVFVEKRDVDRNQRLLEAAKKQAAADPTAIAKKATTTGTASDPDMSIGLAYMGNKQYDKAVESINKSLSKNPQNADAQLTLGIAQLQGGHKDEARKTFKAVKGDPTLERLANLWTLHSQA
jgi:tetratricopeptide (TPR) repeat protein